MKEKNKLIYQRAKDSSKNNRNNLNHTNDNF